ncbi:hypothetical protein ACQ4LE_005425 [Meloidogyne hapla]
MAQCYIDADYQKAIIPGDGITEMEEVLEPHYTFGNYIKECINIRELLEKTFVDSGLDKWIDEMKDDLKGEFENKIRKYAKIGFSEKLDISEIDEDKYKVWLNDSDERLKEIYVEKNYLKFKLWLENKTKKENKKSEKSNEDESKELKEIENERIISNLNENLKIIFVNENLESFNFWLIDLKSFPEKLKKIYVKENWNLIFGVEEQIMLECF